MLAEVPSLHQATLNAATYAVTRRPSANETSELNESESRQSDMDSKKQFTRSKSKEVSLDDIHQVKEDSTILIEGYPEQNL